MGLWEEPNYFPDQRPTGFLRYKQVLERDWKRFFMVHLLTLASLLPFGLGMVVAILSSSVLVLIPVCILGGLIAGPGLAGMYDIILRALRDDCDHWWYSYKKAMKQNWRAALLPGVLLCVFLGFLIFCIALLWWHAGNPSIGTILVLAVGVLLCTMVFTVWWPQVVLFVQRPGIQLKNCLLFCLRYFWKMFRCAGLQMLWWVVTVLFMPWTAFLVPFLGVWYILFLSLFMIYDDLDDAFSIEEQIAQMGHQE